MTVIPPYQLEADLDGNDLRRNKQTVRWEADGTGTEAVALFVIT